MFLGDGQERVVLQAANSRGGVRKESWSGGIRQHQASIGLIMLERAGNVPHCFIMTRSRHVYLVKFWFVSLYRQSVMRQIFSRFSILKVWSDKFGFIKVF